VSSPVDPPKKPIGLGTIDFMPKANLHGMVDLEGTTDEAEFAEAGLDIVNPTIGTISNVTRKHFS